MREYDYYEGQVFRPPSEARSLIVQITTGCSYNKCIYCSMFKAKKFKIKPLEVIREALTYFRSIYGPLKRVFLADGDAMALPYIDLLNIVNSVNEFFPGCERISAYGSCRNLIKYTDQQLSELRKRGLSLIYMGVESGSDQILEDVKKGQDREMILKSTEKLRTAGMILSASVICGLGGKELGVENAEKTAEILNIIDPRYLGLLRLTIDSGTPLERRVREGAFIPQDEKGIIQEMHTLISGLELSDCIVRSNHVCNYVAIAGTIGKDPTGKEAMLNQLEQAMRSF